MRQRKKEDECTVRERNTDCVREKQRGQKKDKIVARVKKKRERKKDHSEMARAGTIEREVRE